VDSQYVFRPPLSGATRDGAGRCGAKKARITPLKRTWSSNQGPQDKYDASEDASFGGAAKNTQERDD
jgi:hypothetical protein